MLEHKHIYIYICVLSLGRLRRRAIKKKKAVPFVDTASRKEMSDTHCYRYRGKGDREKKDPATNTGAYIIRDFGTNSKAFVRTYHHIQTDCHECSQERQGACVSQDADGYDVGSSQARQLSRRGSSQLLQFP